MTDPGRTGSMRLSQETLAYGRAFAGALLGLDALYREESGDETGLACLNMDREGRYPAEVLPDYASAAERFHELDARAHALPEPDRQRYYHDQCRSSLAFIEWREKGLPLAHQLKRFLRGPAEPAPEAELDALRGGMRALLDGMGYPGDLAAQCAAWEERTRVPPEDVPAVTNELLDLAWDRWEARVFPLPADKSDGMRARGVSGVAFNARCDYLERTIDLNTDPVLTRPALKHLAVHEGYGGHYVQFKLRETAVAEERAPADNLLSLVNSASSSVFEGIADAAMEVMEWVDSDDDRLQGLMTRYRAGIGTGAAWRLHVLDWDEGRVTDWLREQSLVGGDGWIENRMAFVSAPSRAVLIWSYWWGEPAVAGVWRRVPEADRPRFLRYLYERMHSTKSLEMFG